MKSSTSLVSPSTSRYSPIASLIRSESSSERSGLGMAARKCRHGGNVVAPGVAFDDDVKFAFHTASAAVPYSNAGGSPAYSSTTLIIAHPRANRQHDATPQPLRRSHRPPRGGSPSRHAVGRHRGVRALGRELAVPSAHGVVNAAFTGFSLAAPHRRDDRVGVIDAAAPRAAADRLQGRPEPGIVGQLGIGRELRVGTAAGKQE